ncbi:cupin domain-containing protein [Sporosarcina pasteurii]|uniref:Thermophilic glucose-6-phosphate isomerase and related metalloenzymes n=1 Tax=Sporosarcina pasteurii TaxID=1474 RepID=A0A380BII1_SPOPA|nr:cupin domain-containing protein [Sporosarcina pasteurii]MDS9470683.1 cupin domain-containing protein [Sporosarcina pasteurii]QBQ05632.1 cupin domain-containing protein [Sporosarcina pasteurii]SUJ01543.1 Thermophilic glucose-6-phosphate isomerase and related metalloenzymes [Sporosarcina pasteurii]
MKKFDVSSPSAEYTFDVNQNTLFKRDNKNFINELSIDQLNTLDNTSVLDIYLSEGKIVEPHYHQNASELVYCISGRVTVSLVNPRTKKLLSYPITSGQVVNVPQGWWHYIVSNADDTHFLGIFNAPKPEVILGSDLLNVTPANIVADTYCVDEEKWKKVTKPIPPSVFIGPPKNCHRDQHEHVDINSTFTDPIYQWSPYTFCKPL